MEKSKKGLLIYPKCPGNTYWSFKHALRIVGKKSNMPPLGIITVAALFPEDWDLKLVDMNIQKLKEKDIMAADAVFLSAMIVQKESFREVVDMCNRLGKPVVAGGAYPTSSHEDIRGVDHFVLGEVEDSFGLFLRDYEQGAAKPVYYPPEKPDIRKSVVPRFDLLNLKKYASMSVQYSRGCPFKCEFCDIWKVYGNKPRLKAPQTVLGEMETLHKLGWKGAIFIVDDNFIGNKHRVKKELLPALTQWQEARKYPYRFFTEASINMASDSKLLTAMSNAGFNEVFIGIETPSVEALAETGKTQNLKVDMAQAIRTIQEHGLEVMAGFILGFDSDTDDIAERQIAFIQDVGIPQAMVGLLTALPGTDLYERLEREGRILRASDGNNTHCSALNFKTKMDEAALQEGYIKVLSTIYDKKLKNYFSRCSQLMDTFPQSDLAPRDIRMAELWIAAKSLLRQPFTSYGFEYVKFITKRSFKKTGTFSQAVKFGIVGHHYHRITRQMVRAEAVAA